MAKVDLPCSIAGCTNQARSRTSGLCEKHYIRWYRHGDPMADKTRRRGECKIEGCGKPTGGLGWCKEHYDRWRRFGDPTHQCPPPTGTVQADGYRVVSRIGHPLAISGGRVLEHRVVLYAKVGPGTHPCHWCSTPVTWDHGWPRYMDALVTDHLDGDRLNNDPANLVPSCNPCNARRQVRRGAA